MGTIHSKQELRKMLALHVQHGAVDADSGMCSMSMCSSLC